MYAFEAIDRIKSAFDWTKKERKSTNHRIIICVDWFVLRLARHTLTNAHHSSFILSCYNLSDHVQATQIIFWLTKWGQMLGIMLLECNNAPSYQSKIWIDMCWWVPRLKSAELISFQHQKGTYLQRYAHHCLQRSLKGGPLMRIDPKCK